MLIPENAKAMEDFVAGKITSQEMWSVINRNIKLQSFSQEVHVHTPGWNDPVWSAFRAASGKLPNGKITRTIKEDGEVTEVIVLFYGDKKTQQDDAVEIYQVSDEFINAWDGRRYVITEEG